MHLRIEGKPLESGAAEDDSSVPVVSRGIRRDHPARLNTPVRPIVNEYREGKVKSTPTRGVKQFLKPCAYKRSEPFSW